MALEFCEVQQNNPDVVTVVSPGLTDFNRKPTLLTVDAKSERRGDLLDGERLMMKMLVSCIMGIVGCRVWGFNPY